MGDVRLGHQGLRHRKAAPAALPAFAVILPLSTVDDRGVQAAITGQRRLDDNTVGNLGGVPVLDGVFDEL